MLRLPGACTAWGAPAAGVLAMAGAEAGAFLAGLQAVAVALPRAYLWMFGRSTPNLYDQHAEDVRTPAASLLPHLLAAGGCARTPR